MEMANSIEFNLKLGIIPLHVLLAPWESAVSDLQNMGLPNAVHATLLLTGAPSFCKLVGKFIFIMSKLALIVSCGKNRKSNNIL